MRRQASSSELAEGSPSRRPAADDEAARAVDGVRVGCSELPDGCTSSRLHVCSGSWDRCSYGVAASFGPAVSAAAASGRFIYSGLLHIFSSSASYTISLQFEAAHMPRPPRSDKKPHWTVQTETVRPRARRMPSFWQRATLSFGSRPSQRYITKRLKRPLRRSRGNLASCPGFGVFVWWRGLSVWSLVRRATLSFTCGTSLNRGETCLLILAALLICRWSVASAVPSRLRPGFLGIYPLLSGRQPKNWPCTSFSGIPCGDFTLGCPRLCPVPSGLGSDDFDGHKSRFGLSLVSWVHLVGLHFFGLAPSAFVADILVDGYGLRYGLSTTTRPPSP